MCLCVAVYVYIQGTDWWRWMGRLFWGKHTHKSSLWSRTGETSAFSFPRPRPHVSECFKMWLFPKSPNQNSHYVTTNGIPQEKASQVVVCNKKNPSQSSGKSDITAQILRVHCCFFVWLSNDSASLSDPTNESLFIFRFAAACFPKEL